MSKPLLLLYELLLIVLSNRSQNTGEGQRSKRQSALRKSSTSEICARPDCSFRDSSDDREFWVNRIVGRKVKVEGGKVRVEVYLVEWEGWVNRSDFIDVFA